MPVCLLPVPAFPSLLAAWLDLLAPVDAITEVLVLTGRTEDFPELEAAIEVSAAPLERSVRPILDCNEHRGAAGALKDVILERSIDNDLLLIEGTSMPPASLKVVFDDEFQREAVEGVFASTTTEEPAGIQLLKHRAFELVPSVGFFDLKEQLLPRIIENGKTVLVRSVTNDTIRLTTPMDYLDLISAFGARTLPGNPIGPWIHENAQVDPTAILANNVLIADGVQVGPGAIIDRSVLLKGVQVGAEALIARSIIRPNTQVPPRTRLVESEEILLDARGGVRRRPNGRVNKPAYTDTSSQGASA